MARHFAVTISVYEDGTLSVVNSDIKGLIIEVGTIDELLVELQRMASRLLMFNHGLSDEEIAQATLRLNVESAENVALQWMPEPLTPLPGVLWAEDCPYPANGVPGPSESS